MQYILHSYNYSEEKEDTKEDLWITSKKIATNVQDVKIKCSNPRYGDLRLAYTNDNSHEECMIMARKIAIKSNF